MQEITTNISWIAVILGAVLSFALGWLWYGKLFLEPWAKGVGVDPGAPEEMPKFAMFAQLAGLFLLCWFVGVMASMNLLLTTLLAVLAFIMLGMSGSAFRLNSSAARYIDAGYWAVSVVVMIILQGIF